MTTKTKQTPVEDIDLVEASRQIVEKAARERSTIEDQVRQAQQILGNAREQRAKVEDVRQKRAAWMADFEQIATDLHQKHQAAISYARMATGTLGEHKAISDALAAQKLVTDHQPVLEQERASARDLDQAETSKIAELDTIIREQQAILSAAPPRLQEIANVEAQALHELGQAEYARFLEECVPYDDRLEKAREELTAAQMERHAFLMQSADRLALWGNLQGEVLSKLPGPDNATLRIMRSALAYINQLIEDRMALARQLPESWTATHFYGSVHGGWWNTLAVGADLLYNYRSLQSRDIPELQTRRDQLAQILAEYEKAHMRDGR